MRAIFPANAVDSGATQPSLAVACVPVATSSALPDCGTEASEPAARLYVYIFVPTLNAGRVAFLLSNDATPMTFRPTPGAPADQSWPPLTPLFPIEATTVTPAAARLSAATAVGYCGQLLKDEP